ncbi:hypothetical protein KW783_01750 [Candidatus Parcubacteria bacterium]|nr:hypothetical protein [Candidatus Parcubacteria bacterium]
MKYFVFITLVFCIPFSLFAHGTGLALEHVVGQYNIDIHYPIPFQAEQPILLNFFLEDSKEISSADFSDADVTILQGDEVILKTNIAKKVNIATAAVITFPKAGPYRIYVAFNLGKTKIVDTTFDVNVTPHKMNNEFLGINFNKELLIGIAFGILLSVGLVLVRKTEQA